MKTKKLVPLILTLLMVLATLPMQRAVAAEPKRYYVTKTGTGDGIGGWDTASSNLKGIMDAAQSGDEIWVAKGTYSPGNQQTNTFNLKKGVKVYGGFAGGETELSQRNWVTNVTTLNGGGINRHVVTGEKYATTDARLDGFTIKGGNATSGFGGGMSNNNSSPTVTNCTFSDNTVGYSGGGMYNFNSSPTVTNCTFSGNTANTDGGGMYNENSSPTVTNCTFSGNKADSSGGGMYNSSNSSSAVVNCTFSGNTANADGGGMYNDNSSPTVTNCTFSDNTAKEKGGGMYNVKSSPMVENCAFTANTTNKFGGGMYNANSSSPKVVNCTFSGNKADISGGGMSNSNSSPTVANCTFSGNAANNYGGGIYNGDSSPTLANAILWGNTAANDNDGPDIYQHRKTLTLKNCVVGIYRLAMGATIDGTPITGDPNLQPLDKDGNAVANPALNPIEVYIYALGSGSSAVDAGLGVGTDVGNGVTVPGTDQLGTLRPIGAGVDIGAYEAAYTITSVTVTPETASVEKGKTQQFTVNVTGTGPYNNTVTWSVAGGSSPGTTISDGGLLTVAANETATTLTVKATSNGQSAQYDTATVTVQASGIAYAPVNQDGQPDNSTHSYTRSSGSYLEIIIRRSVDDHKTFGLFRQLMMDGAPVSESYYTKEAGSLIVRLKASWLDTLAAGLHNLRFVFEDGEATASFTLKAKPGSFEDVAVASSSFTFTKRWQGGAEQSIDWTLYDEQNAVAHKLFNKKVVSQTEWRYNAWFDNPVKRYVIEKPVPGYGTRYQNVGVYAGITDRCCNGGTIINYKIPPTGDGANPALWAILALLGLAGMGIMLLTGRRRKASK